MVVDTIRELPSTCRTRVYLTLSVPVRSIRIRLLLVTASALVRDQLRLQALRTER